MPGGDFPVDGVPDLIAKLRARYGFVDARWAERLVKAYGTQAFDVLGDAQVPADLGTDFGANLTQREVVWLMEHEFARSAADIVWRRSKLGLRMTEVQIAALDAWIGDLDVTDT
jgi:glycerol-3-phosphate dehydrogenase